MPDHLNYYGTMEKYFQDKKYIFSNQKPKDWLIVNYDDQILKEAVKDAASQIIKFSYEPLKKSRSVFIEDDAIYLNNGIDVKKLVSIKDILIPGRHNLSNVMAAIGAVFAMGLTATEIKKALPLLKGVAHRLEFVHELKGVKYYNDTAATIPDAAISALNAFEQPIVLIAGGTDKNLDFTDFAKEILEKTKSLVLLKGNATEKLLIKLRKISSEEFLNEVEVVGSMDEALVIAQKKSEKGDVVVLSPGAASFGLFANEFDRGDKFRESVKKLK
jgi:UDP-N-acetylmuramoylalanine--D-glutamate ligase